MALATCDKCKQQFAVNNRFCSYCGAPNENVASVPASGKMNYDLFLLGIPVIATLLVWLWVGGMAIDESPEISLTLVIVAAVLGTAVAGTLEARALGMKRDGKGRERQFDPVTWFVLLSLLWVFAYPSYLYKRKFYGAMNLAGVGVMLAIIFSASVVAMAVRLDAKREETSQPIPDTTITPPSPERRVIDKTIMTKSQIF